MPCAKVHITSSACPKNNVAVWSDLWIASRGDSRTDWSVDCLQRRFKNRLICGLLTEEIQEQNDLWTAYRGDSRTKWSVDCLQRRFKNRLICGLLTEEIQEQNDLWIAYRGDSRTDWSVDCLQRRYKTGKHESDSHSKGLKRLRLCVDSQHAHTCTHTHTQTHINTEVLSPQTQGHSTSKIFFFSPPPPPPPPLNFC